MEFEKEFLECVEKALEDDGSTCLTQEEVDEFVAEIEEMKRIKERLSEKSKKAA